jgi:single-stranded-DNA-specific exonuclease
MAFRAIDTDLGRFLLSSRGDQIHVAGTLNADYWQGSRRIQFRISDAARAG